MARRARHVRSRRVGITHRSRASGEGPPGTASCACDQGQPASCATTGSAVKQYEIWWAELPEPVGTRPILLLSRDGAYQYLHRVLAVEITSHRRGIPQEVELGAREGLPRRCVANFDNLRAVSKHVIRTRAGQLSSRRVAEVKRAL